jgi:hypothetical protein
MRTLVGMVPAIHDDLGLGTWRRDPGTVITRQS